MKFSKYFTLWYVIKMKFRLCSKKFLSALNVNPAIPRNPASDKWCTLICIYNQGHYLRKMGNSLKISKRQTNWNCCKLSWMGRVLTLSFNARLNTYSKIWGSKSSKIVQQGSEYSLEACRSLPNRNIRLHLRDSPKSTFSPELNIFWSRLYET